MGSPSSGGAPAGSPADRPLRVVLGVGGGIAAYKAASLLRLLTESGHDVTVVPTDAALNFVGAPTWAALSGKAVTAEVFDDVEQVRHVRLGQEADLVVIAPATANLLAKAAHGLADDLLTNVLLTARGPVLLAPAMHTEMWQHPATVANVATLRARGVHVIDPASGRLTGKDTGPGRLPDPEVIFAEVQRLLGERAEAPVAVDVEVRPSEAYFSTLTLDGVEARMIDGVPVPQDLAGVTVLVTAGGTREALDPVRYLGNRSSGKQGIALARTAADRGAHVMLVACALEVPLPDDHRIVIRRAESALDLQGQVHDLAGDADVVVMAAAVADFRPARYADAKIKKTHAAPDDESAPTIELVRNPDILRELVVEKASRISDLDSAQVRRWTMPRLIVGFAAETGDAEHSVLDLGREKLARKGCDLLVVNEVGRDTTFGKDDNAVTILAADGSAVQEQGSKEAVSHRIWDSVAALLRD